MITPLPYISASTSRCPRCEATEVRPALVTGFGAYWRCAPCGHSWLVPRGSHDELASGKSWGIHADGVEDIANGRA